MREKSRPLGYRTGHQVLMKQSENSLQKGTSHKVQLFHAVNEAHKKWEIKKQNTCKQKETRNSTETAEKV
jgi:hypothetical protein